MSEEIHELQEHAEEAHHDPTLAPVTVTMAVLAVLVATVSLLGHRTHTEELLLQNQSTDRWAQYQAKSIRRHNYDMFADLLSVSAVRDAEAASKLRERYAREVERYREDQKELDAEARKLEAETAHARRQADRFDLAEVFLEVALVITSMTLLTRRRAFWLAALVIAAVGLVVGVSGFLAH
jgi:hypothetical protein